MKKPVIQVILLIIASVVTRVPFVLHGFGEIDATKIAVSVIDMINHGKNAAFNNYYFTDVVPLYILYLKFWIKYLNFNISALPLIMNYTNAIFGILTVVPCYLLIRRLFHDDSLAFFTVLPFTFVPSFYQSTIMGFPHLIAFFFLVSSFYLFLVSIDDKSRISRFYFYMSLSCVALTIAFLFKSDYVLGAGAFAGILFIRKITDKSKFFCTFLILLVAGVLFLLLRNLILGVDSGTTMTKEGLEKWYNYSIAIPTNISFFLRQVKPVAYGAGLATFFLTIVSLIYLMIKKKWDIIIFFISWSAVPTIFWLVLIGNNARHNMISVLPMLLIIVYFFRERMPKLTGILSIILVLGNYFITTPSPSILTPSGRLLASHTMLKKRMERFHSAAVKLANIKNKKVAVLGYFHNPHVIFELMKSSPKYKAVKIGREDYKFMTGNREILFLYFAIVKKEDMKNEIKYFIDRYDLEDYLFASATYDLSPLRDMGLNTITVDLIKKSTL